MKEGIKDSVKLIIAIVVLLVAVYYAGYPFKQVLSVFIAVASVVYILFWIIKYMMRIE